MSKSDVLETREKVRVGYAKVATANTTCCTPPTGCCGGAPNDSATALAASVGYDHSELAELPEGANMGLSCGNPTALASLKPGEVVLDLGSGGGFDVFIAGRKVDASGRVIGVDMTAEMLAKARHNTALYRERTGLDNVEFRLGEIEHLPVADASVDVVISNCVINLSPEKPAVWKEIARVLKPGGRVAVSDIALLQPLPPHVLEMVEALVGCIAGAVLVEETEQMARAAGLVDIQLEPRHQYIDAMVENMHDVMYAEVMKQLPAGTRASDYIVSLAVSARKPEAAA